MMMMNGKKGELEEDNYYERETEKEKEKSEKERNIILRSSASCAPRIIRIKSWSVISFFKLIDEELDDFFQEDKCCKIADNYLLAMVFTYFLRASLRPEEYTETNFFVALYLAHDMEEDRDDARMLLRDYIGLDDPEVCTSSPQLFFQLRDKFWKRMYHRGAVSRLCCDKVMQMIRPFHKIWSRKRHVNHSGATRDVLSKENSCPNCVNNFLSPCSNSSSEFSPEVITQYTVKNEYRRPTLANGKTLNPRYKYNFE